MQWTRRLLVLGLSSTACAETDLDPPWDPSGWDPSGYDLIGETTYLKIWSDKQVTLCAGDVRGLDEQIELGASIVGVPFGDIGIIDVLLTSDYGVIEVEGCPPFRSCYLSTIDTVATTRFALWHEINHAVSTRRGATSGFIAEGFAEALSSWDESTLDTNVISQFLSGEREYLNSRTFVQWLLTFHGHERYQAFVDALNQNFSDDDPWPIEHALQDAYGWTTNELIQQMADTMPASFWTPYGHYCDGEVVGQMPGPLPRWGFTVELDCASEHTRGLWSYSDRQQPDIGPDAHTSLNALTRRYTLDIPIAGTYRLATEAPLAVVRPCVAPAADPDSASPTWWGPLKYIPSGDPLQLNHDDIEVAGSGTLMLEVGGSVDGPVDYEVSLVAVSLDEP
jgi:hypothetical protein